MTTLLSSTIRIYSIIALFLYIILFAYHGDICISWYNALNIFTLFTFALVLWMSNRWAEVHFTCKNLGITTFVYSLIFVGLYLLMSDYYSGNTFLFSEADARAYYNFSTSFLEKAWEEWIPFLKNHGWDFEDWGAPVALTMMLHFIPSKLFVNFCYIIMNTTGALCLFKMGKTIMTTRYAYLGALTYAISSYTLFFMGSFLKEEMLVFIVILSYFMLYMYMKHGRMEYLIGGGAISFLVVFFRPPIILFIGMSYMMMLFFKTKNGALRYFVIFIVVIASIAAIGIIQYSADKYANGGDFTEQYYFVNTSLFQKVVLYAGAFIGPFPYLLQTDEEITLKSIYGAGLLFKFLLAYAFWKGLWHAARHKHMEVIPIYIFVVLEMLGLSISLDGLELRKAMPHVPFFVLTAFWYLDQLDNETDETVTSSSSYIWSRKLYYVCMFIVFIAVSVWNTLNAM